MQKRNSPGNRFARLVLRQKWLKPKFREKLRQELPPATVHCMDCEFYVHPADNYSEFFLWKDRKLAEFVGTSTVANILAGTNPVIVDVGANAGLFFLPILNVAGPNAKALVFEPNPVMVERLKHNISLNNFDNVSIFECAIGDEAGQSSLYFPPFQNLGQGRVGEAYKGKNARRGVDIQVRPLLECLNEAEISRIDLLKVDVEGLEDRVIYPLLVGPGHLLPRLIYFEVAHRDLWKHPLMRTLKAKGYRLLDDFGENHLYELKQ